MVKRPVIVRKNGRIYFGEGRDQWSCWDPAFATTDTARQARGADWTWFINCTPTVRELLTKVRLIRWAVHHVPVTRRIETMAIIDDKGVINCAEPIESDPPSQDSRCPKCGGEMFFGYGGAYEGCDADGCDYFSKTQDTEE